MAERYRLEALLRVKQREKQRAEFILAKCIRELQEAKEKLERLKEEKKKILKQQKEARLKMDAKMSVGDWIGHGNFHVNFLRKLKEDEEAKQEEIEDQEKVIEEAKGAVAKAKKNYNQACRELKVMEKHKELWAKKVRREINRREERAMDEMGQIIYNLRRWRGEKTVFGV